MIRILLVFLVIFALALGGVWLADHPGTVVITWLGYEIVAPMAFALGVLTGLIVLVLTANFFITLLLKGGLRLARFFARRRAQRSRRAIAAGVLALSVEDGRAARRAYNQIGSGHDRDVLARLIAAKSADLLGQHEDAREAYLALLGDPRGELAGLLGLCDLAKIEGDGTSARDYARRAFVVDSGNRQAFRSHFTFLLDDHAWDGARHAVDAAYKHGALAEDRARTMTAVLFAAEAGRKLSANRPGGALGPAHKALGLDKTCLPAAIVAAEALVRLGKRAKAAGVIEDMWVHHPHPRLGEMFLSLVGGETPAERLQRVQGLVSLNREHGDSGLLLVRAALDAQRFLEAREELERLSAVNLTSRVARLFVELERVDGADPTAVERWLIISAEAPRERGWVCQACGHGQPDWSATCPACGRFDTLEWHVAQAVPGLLPMGGDETVPLGSITSSRQAEPAIEGSPALAVAAVSTGLAGRQDVDAAGAQGQALASSGGQALASAGGERPVDALLRRINPDAVIDDTEPSPEQDAQAGDSWTEMGEADQTVADDGPPADMVPPAPRRAAGMRSRL